MSLETITFELLVSWGSSVEAQDKVAVLNHYHDNAVLWPTLSDTLRTDREAISDYFSHFLPKIAGPVQWDHSVYQPIDATHVIWSGTYTFQLVSGPTTARFTYGLRYDNGRWTIYHHHSSLLPTL